MGERLSGKRVEDVHSGGGHGETWQVDDGSNLRLSDGQGLSVFRVCGLWPRLRPNSHGFLPEIMAGGPPVPDCRQITNHAQWAWGLGVG